ncbi:MAG: hypothetical protein JSS43_03895 [Proteobacteria bacterium]|nr:hypothetical protein [Pseudomonadota bacterium]
MSAIPNLTGTSVNPLLRAVYLIAAGWSVTLYVPWFEPDDQLREYGCRLINEEAQRHEIQAWLPESLRCYQPKIVFYPARYGRRTMVPHPVTSLSHILHSHDAVVFEELERHFLLDGHRIDTSAFRLKKRIPLIVSIMHTNQALFGSVRSGRWWRPLAHGATSLLVRAICHCSYNVQSPAPMLRDHGESVVSLNGISDKYLTYRPRASTSGAYFIGKLIPEKGLHNTFRLLRAAGATHLDVFGSGDLAYVRSLEAQYGVAAVLRGGTAAPWLALAPYRVFVNCSLSEVLCTTTAEALAMRKWVIVPRHPSNQIFAQFDNCLVYGSDAEFLSCWHRAMANEPSDDPKVAAQLSWAAATRRIIHVMTEQQGQRHYDPPPYHAVDAAEHAAIRYWLGNSSQAGGHAVTGSHPAHHVSKV